MENIFVYDTLVLHLNIQNYNDEKETRWEMCWFLSLSVNNNLKEQVPPWAQRDCFG